MHDWRFLGADDWGCITSRRGGGVFMRDNPETTALQKWFRKFNVGSQFLTFCDCLVRRGLAREQVAGIFGTMNVLRWSVLKLVA